MRTLIVITTLYAAANIAFTLALFCLNRPLLGSAHAQVVLWSLICAQMMRGYNQEP